MQKRRYSLNVFFTVIGLILLVVIAAVIISTSAIASYTIRRQTYEIMDRATAMEAQHIQDELAATAAHLNGFSYDNADIITLETSSSYSGDWFSALNRLRNSFDTAVASEIAEHYFLYIPKSGVFITGGNPLTAAQQSVLQTMIGESGGQQPRCWRCVMAGEVSYLTYVLRVNNSFVGAWVSVDTALAGSGGSGEQSIIFDMADSEGNLLGSEELARQMEDYSPSPKNGYQMVTLDGRRYLLVAHAVSGSEFSLVALVPNASLGSAVLRYLLVVLPIVIAALAVVALLFHSAWRTITQPVGELTQVVRRQRAGDAEAQVTSVTPLVELSEMNTAFNGMIREIRDLKIGVYEEQLLRQNIQIEYLKMQVTPHFLINCLNSVYQLTEAGQPELTMRMVRGLSRHLRYMLSAEVMVPLRQELEMVENYVDLSSIRYPGCLELTTDYAPEAMGATAIPLLVLNFVENTVKYEAGIGKRLPVHVSARAEERGGEKRLCITIWDGGGGFPEELLRQLTDIPTYIKDNQNRHIGISNVFQRAKLIMGECYFQFSNRPGAGAQIDIEMPFVPYYREGERS